VILVPRAASGRVDPKEDTTVTVARTTVDRDAYLDLVIVYLGMRVRATRGLRTVLGVRPQIGRSWREEPDGCCCTKTSCGGSFRHMPACDSTGVISTASNAGRAQSPTGAGGRRSGNTAGTGSWHEAYFARSGIDAMYVDMTPATGLALRSRDPRTWCDVLSAPAGRSHRSRHRAGSSQSHSSTRRRETRFSPLNQPSSTPTARFR
jgi:hypothetical protein